MFIPSKFSGYRADGRRLLPGGGKNDAPAPDPNIGFAAQKQIELAEKQYDDFTNNYAPFLKEQMAQGLRISGDQNRRDTEMQEYQLGRARTMDSRYDSVQVPLEDQLIAKAKLYNEDAEQERMARMAGEDVGASFDGAAERIGRGLAARGIRGDSGAAMAALGEASAINKTRQAAKDIGWTRLGEAAALGKGLPSFGSTSAGLSLSAGQNALSAGTAGVGLVGSASGASNAGYGAGISGFGAGASTLNQRYSTQMQGYGIKSANDPTNAILGAATGAGMAYMTGGASMGAGSDIRLKFDIKQIGETDYGLPIYTFRYKHDPSNVVVGVMAHEVAQIRPQAYLHKGYDGVHDAVDYSKI